ncbi:MAG: hypothetical protein ABEN55_12645 [Bradymonadaceae bacterium]
MQCDDHPRRPADYSCVQCDGTWCGDCTVLEQTAGNEVPTCPNCRSQMLPTGGTADGGERGRTTGSSSRHGKFFGKLLVSLFYPLAGGGLMMLFFGAFIALMTAVGLVIFLPLLALGIGGLGYLTKYYFKIIQTTGNGDDELPDWPVWGDFFAACILPLFQFTMLHVVAFGPAFFLRRQSPESLAGAVALLAGALYFPMGLLGLSIDQSITGLNPFRALVSIVKTPVHYFFTLVGIAATGTVSSLVLSAFGSLGALGIGLAVFTYIYFLAVEARILGLLYYANRERLDWY